MAARDAEKLTELAKKKDDEGVSKLLANKSNAEMERIKDSLAGASRTEAGLKRDTKGNYKLSSDGDLNSSLNNALNGKRVEGREAAPTDGKVEDLSDKVLQARVDPKMRALGMKKGPLGTIGSTWNGTDEKGMSDAIMNASDGQLRRLDSRLKAGVKDEAGDVVQFDKGIEGLLKSEFRNGWGKEPVLDLMMERVKRALGN